jgi:hypothetical protein
MSIRHTACTLCPLLRDHLLTLPFGTQVFSPSLEDKHIVADETANTTGFTQLQRLSGHLFAFRCRPSLRLLIVHFLWAGYVDGMHQDYNSLQ